jgi:hypothetical protein
LLIGLIRPSERKAIDWLIDRSTGDHTTIYPHTPRSPDRPIIRLRSRLAWWISIILFGCIILNAGAFLAGTIRTTM